MRSLLPVIALVLGAGAARADNGYLYLGAGVSKDKVSDIVHGPTSFADIDGTSWKTYFGFRYVSAVAVEADYIDLGTQNSNSVLISNNHTDANAFAAYVVGFLPIPLPFLDVFAKAGLARWKLEGSSTASLAPGPFSTDGTDLAWGVGTQAHIGDFGARLEYESFHIAGTSGAKVVSLDVYLNIL
jgi:OmpA-like transmembrane domain